MMIRYRILLEIMTDAEFADIKCTNTPLGADARTLEHVTVNELLEKQWEALQQALAPCPWCQGEGGRVEVGDTDQGQEEMWIVCTKCGGDNLISSKMLT